MSQQAKDIYSGIKKIFPGSRRSGSFSFTGRMSAAGLDAELSAEAQAAAREKPSKKKEGRHSSFSLSGWREKHRASSEPAVVMSLPYGAQAATPKAKKAPGDENRPSLTQTLNNAFHTAPSRGSLFGGGKGGTKAAGKEPSNSRSSRNSQSGFSTSAFEPPKLGARSVSAGGDRPPCMGNRALRNSGVHGNVALQLQPGATLAAPASNSRHGHKTKVRSASQSLTGYGAVKTAPSSYQSSSSSISAMTASGPGRGSFQGQNLSSSGVYTAEKGKRAKKERGMSLSFSSSARKERKREKAEAEERERALRAAYSKNEQAVVKPHASTWDSDSDDDYEDTKRPTRGLDRRSQSMDFMEQAPEHLISKIWRKLPIQARLIGGRGNIDLDLQKDRTSFSRSSEARKFAVAAEKAKAAELLRRSISGRKEPSPVPAEEVLSPGVAKRTRFSMKPIVVAFDANDGAAGAYTALESYDDVLVRVCKFAAHDQRPTTTKVQEFLERSMAFLHGTRTKHGNVVNISNEEIRMWRRLALHDWVLEEVTTAQAAAALGVKGKDVEAPSSRTSSSVTEGTDSDSDSQYSRAPRRLKSASFHRSLSESVVEEEPEEEGDEDELDVPSNVKLEKLCDVVNCCVNFGEVLFTPDEVNDLVRLEFIVEEDGWI
ncbi:Sterol 3-beta-glucosyltransferase [Phytophthora cinnamomi]|uniref:Sterol 3-beta-glucosyltransferase n=1 Tax=Phytophthora cinnamomi TaxID=4785 RepID=UPI0035599B16|nr:Sterol 3-beta-glucosyltransferase [Phytophthora cinnamomi]